LAKKSIGIERTLAIIKPDAVKKGAAGDILKRWEKAGFKILAMKMVHLTRQEAEGFYMVHKGKPFYKSLTRFMSEGPCIVLVLEGKGVIERNRKLMGATDSRKAARGTIRKKHGMSIERNAVHGSDGPDTAAWEIAYFFSPLELIRSDRDFRMK
jgi:nucleoside-diphosphate kinase